MSYRDTPDAAGVVIASYVAFVFMVLALLGACGLGGGAWAFTLVKFAMAISFGLGFLIALIAAIVLGIKFLREETRQKRM